MKKFMSLFTVISLVMAVMVFTSCSPVSGLDPVEFEDIASAKMTGTYTLNSSITYRNTDGEITSSKKDTEERIPASAVKAAAATLALVNKFSGQESIVYANKDFTKVTFYHYVKDTESGVTLEEYCYKYVKEKKYFFLFVKGTECNIQFLFFV